MSVAPTVEELIQRGRAFAALRQLHAEASAAPPRRAHHLRRRVRGLALELAPAIGRAWFAFEGPLSARAAGGLARVDVFEGYDPSCPALAAGARLADRPDAALHMTFWPPGVAAGLTGRSVEIAQAVAAWSRLTGVPIPAGVVFTGQIEGDGLAAPPAASCAEKVKVVAAELGRTGRLIVGARDGATLGALLSDAVGVEVGGPRPLMSEVEDARRAFADRDYQRAARLTKATIERGDGALDADTLVDLGRMRLAALTHEGEVDAALDAWANLAPHLPAVSPARRARAAAANAVILLDVDRALDAAALLDATIAPLLDAPWHDASTRYALCELCGTRARVASALGDHASAALFGARALAFTRPYERARNHGDLALWHLRAGDPSTALAHLDEADAALPATEAVDAPSAQTTAGFLRVFRARALLDLDEPEAAEAMLKGLDADGHFALALVLAEIRGRLGHDLSALLDPLDASRSLAPGAAIGAATRLRARIELRRPSPDHAAIRRWTGVDGDPTALLATLDAEVPY